jgi:peptidoglycan/LPS O-acetylase OafA/YrhL
MKPAWLGAGITSEAPTTKGEARAGQMSGSLSGEMLQNQEVRTTEPHQSEPIAGVVTGYRPWLDGVRGVAVLMVVVEHASNGLPVDLGFVGVGLFFALSGYLITSLLLDEREVHGGVSLSRFYLRRAARLLPALVLVVLTCDVLFVAFDDTAPVRGSVFALTYFANYVQVLRPQSMPGFGPTWTLAVEEHFYIVWPLAMLFVLTRYRMRTVLLFTLVACVAALGWRAILAAESIRLSLLETGSFERADALLYGCAAAIAVRIGWRPSKWMLAVAIVGVIAVTDVSETYSTAVFGHALLAIAAAVTVVALDYAPITWIRRLLSTRAIVTVGVLSYGIYLWHGPLMRLANDAGLRGQAWAAVAGFVAVGAAALSHRYVEAPIRAWARRRGTVAAAPRLAEPVRPEKTMDPVPARD